jgi:DNA (cytosine-5)-methyltransferase 1
MLRVIAESRPRWVVAENVPGLISIQNGVVFEQVCADLENEGYAVQAFIIPACAKNAPHRRDRVWIVGHSNERDGRGFLQGTKWETVGIKQSDSDAPDAEGNGQRAGLCKGGPGKEWWGRPPDPWGTPWIEVATRLCRVDDGLPAWVYRHRVARLKALGNAIVPQVAYEIIKEIVKESKNEPQ